MEKLWDIVIIGAGPSGLTAAIYASRARMSTLVLEKTGAGGQLALTEKIDNYPGFKQGVNSFELIEQMEGQAQRAGAQIVPEEVLGIQKEKESFLVNTRKQSYKTLCVIIAAGALPKRLGIPGEERLTGKGVSYCATCDAMFFKDKNVAVIGGGDSALEEALFLTKFCAKTTIIHRRDRLRAAKILQEEIEAKKDKASLCLSCVVKEIKGKDRVESLVVEDVGNGQVREMAFDGVFIFAGYTPNSGFAKQAIKTDGSGYIVTGEDFMTSQEGIFACGDIRKNMLKQVVVACGEGAAAAYNAQKYVERLKGVEYK